MSRTLLPHEARRRRERWNRVTSAGWLAREGVRAIAGVALVAGLLAFSAEIWLRRTWAPAGLGEPVATPVEPSRQMRTQLQLQRIEAAITTFRLRNGAIPASLDQLVADGLLSDAELREPGYVRRYFYRPAGSAYVLLPPAY